MSHACRMHVAGIGQTIFIVAISVHMFDKITLMFVREKSKLSVKSLK